MEFDPRKLHRRAISGEALTASEAQALAGWYAEQDRAEDALLNGVGRAPSLVNLQEQVSAAVQQLTQVSQQVKDAVVANEALRSDLASLQAQLTHSASRRAA